MDKIKALIENGGWQPIETAPRDGSVIRARVNNWYSHEKEEVLIKPFASDGWQLADTGDQTFHNEDIEAWQPNQLNPDLIALVNSVVEVCECKAREFEKHTCRDERQRFTLADMQAMMRSTARAIADDVAALKLTTESPCHE